MNSETPSSNDVARHRIRRILGGRPQIVVAATVAMVGFGLAGISAAVTNSNDDAPESASAEATYRDGSAQLRADRGDRPSTSPSASMSLTVPKTTAPTTEAAPKATQKSATPEATKSSAAPKATKAKAAWVTPMPGAETTSCYGQRWGVLHAGVDLALDEGTPIHAAGAGTIVAAGWEYSGYGISVVIDHGNGYLTHYAHQSRVAVSVGDKVSAGDVIGYEGTTGDSTGPHLHFEVHQGMWNQIDPQPWMAARGVDLGC